MWLPNPIKVLEMMVLVDFSKELEKVTKNVKISWFAFLKARASITSRFYISYFVRLFHGVLKSQKKSHLTLRAKRATFTF